MKIRALLTNFTGGELTPRVHGRVDIKKYAAGCRVIENALVVPHGGARRRQGTEFIIRQRNNTDTVQLVYFQYSTEQAYVLVFGPNYVWFLKDRGIITQTPVVISGITQANPAVATATAHGFVNGDVVLIQSVTGMTEVNNRHFVVAAATANTFELTGLDSTGFTPYTAGGTAAEIVMLATSYTQDEVADLQFTQVNDVLYIVHQNHPVQKISRLSHTSWTLTEPDINTGPFRTINSDRDLRITLTFDSWNISNVTQANPAVVTSTAHGFVNGSRVVINGVVGMTELNGNIYDAQNVTANTFELAGIDSTAYTAYVSGGIASAGPTTYGTFLVGDQVNLVATGALFDAGHVGALFRLNEEGSIGVASAPIGDGTAVPTVGDVYTNDGKVYGIGVVQTISSWRYITRVPAHASGTVRVFDGYAGAGGSDGYGAGGRYLDVDFLHPGYCIVRIESVASSTAAVARIVTYQLPASIAQVGTSFWEEGAWSDYRGYPNGTTLFEQRLWLGGSPADPTVIWSSKSGTYEDFTDGAEDDDAIIYRLASGAGDVVRWLSGGRILTAGTSAGEYAISASNQNEALTPSNVAAKVQTTFGTSPAQPIRINQAVLYPQRSGNVGNPARKLREFAYAFQQDAYASQDLTIFSEHVTGSGFDQVVHILDPDSLIYLRRIDGMLASCTYERDQEVVAWHRQRLGGTNSSTESIAAVPGADGDEVYLSVARTIDGETVKSIEVFAPDVRVDTAKEDGVFLDSAVTYQGASTTTLSGLNHLEGETVDVLNNGAVERGKSVLGGRITLDRATTKAVIGHRYTTIIETTDIEAGARAGTGQSRPKKIDKAWLRLVNSLGGKIGTRADDMKEIIYRRVPDVMDDSPPLFSGLIDLVLIGGWQREAVVRIEHDEPLPLFVAGVIAEMDTNG